ncbi:NRDE family protein [Marinobacter sp. M216]|uniref:NRDE family protein n=1 Tax=Marinobacter albus TaxID=3030833 RepID=A0ABT7HHQ4_9GAMM|nr:MULTISPECIES: NRDE family protein [unclassified Marinobacter]MBW7472895.1 NRDE family protein [Marinobacter sp. F4218]MDK9559447.1 NRDE family protein [Marinobacter sp. M216]
MCLIAFTLGQNANFPLVVAANRDEFFRRPTAPMDWWETTQGTRILAGRDLQSGGTWLAISGDGTVSAVTNVREGTPEDGRNSRGELPLRALEEPIPDLAARLSDEPGQYAGFNLVYLNDSSGWYYSNRDAHPGRNIHRGVYGLSNHLLQTPWPKLLRLRQAVGDTVASADNDAEALHQELIALLQDTTPAPDHLLPDTGVGIDTERFLSSPFIVGDSYGTRATTIVSVSRSGEIRVSEQGWGPNAEPHPCRRFHWQR